MRLSGLLGFSGVYKNTISEGTRKARQRLSAVREGHPQVQRCALGTAGLAGQIGEGAGNSG